MEPVQVWRGVRTLAAVAALMALSACAEGQTGPTQAADPPPEADHATRSDHFKLLQQAGLGGNYAAFAGHLKASDPAPVVAALQKNFRGGPFDVYTQKSVEAGGSHKRLVELRSTSGRLYLFLQLDQVPGGWNVAGYEIGRSRAAISAKL